MTSIDYAARRQKLTAAIDALIEGGAASVTLDDGTSVTKLDLPMLRQMEAEALKQERRAARPRGAFRIGAPK